VDAPLFKAAEGIHGPLFLAAESGLAEELSKFGDDMPLFRITICAAAGVGELKARRTARNPSQAVAAKIRPCSGVFVFIRIILLFGEQAFAASAGKNHQFFFLSVLLDQHAVGADAQQFEVA